MSSSAPYFKLICGPMFSGKTKLLINFIDKAKIRGRSFLVIRKNGYHRVDVDGENDTLIKSRYGSKVIKCIDVDNLKDVEIHDDIKLIFIDEGHFFKDIESFVRHNFFNNGISIITTWLNGDYKQEPFEFTKIDPLIAMGAEIITLKAICIFKYCENDAIYTKRICNNKSVILKGDKEYYPCCYNCLNKVYSQTS